MGRKDIQPKVISAKKRICWSSLISYATVCVGVLLVVSAFVGYHMLRNNSSHSCYGYQTHYGSGVLTTIMFVLLFLFIAGLILSVGSAEDFSKRIALVFVGVFVICTTIFGFSVAINGVETNDNTYYVCSRINDSGIN